MRGVARMMGIQKPGGLLGVHGDTMLDSSAECGAGGRRVMNPQREYPIFTPGFREPAVQTGSADQSRASTQDSDGQGFWKEIHTDTQSTAGHSSHSISFDTSHILTPCASAANLHSSPYTDYMEPPPFMSAATTTCSTLAPGSLSANSTTSFYTSVQSSPVQRNYNIPGMRASPVMTTVPHSPQNVNILSPQLRPLEKSPKRTQLNIASPRLTESGGLTPMVNQLTLSPEQQRLDYDLTDSFLSSNMLPPASMAQSPHPVTLRSPANTPISSSMKMKKMMKTQSRQQAADQSPRPSVSKDRSPGRTWTKKPSLRAGATPVLASIRDDQAQNSHSVRGLTREMNNSFQGNKPRASASAAVQSWRGYGDGGQSQEFSVEVEQPDAPSRVGGKKPPSTHKSGSYNIFNFLSWGKKKSSTGAGTAMKLAESLFDSDVGGTVKADSDSIKVLDYTIKTLRYKVEQANQKRAAAVEEVRALQSAVEASDEKCRQLTARCQELELKLTARSSGLWEYMELEQERDNNATYIVRRRELDLVDSSFGPPRRFSSQELFLKVFEDSITSLRKLAGAICHHIRVVGESATQVIISLLEQHKVGRVISRMPRNVIILYFESFLNQVMFESFENVSFEPNGASSVFDPDTLKQTCYQSYQSLKNQEWSTIAKSLDKPGALIVNANFHRFFVVRMELILSQLGKLAENEISLNLMASFFNAVKAVWLVHHMAFAFDQPVSIFRVSPAADFEARFMEQVTAFEDPESNLRSKVNIMLNPGFIVSRQIIKCQVYCSSKYE